MKYYNIFLAESKIVEEKETLRNFLYGLFNDSLNEQEIAFSDDIIEILGNIGKESQIAEFLFTQLKGDNKLEIDGEIKNVEEVHPHKSKPDFFEIIFTKPNGSKAKSEMKVGKFITALVKEINDRNLKPKPQDIEYFVKLIYAERSGDTTSLYEFRLVSGDDIVKYYNEKQSEVLSGGLGGSCMRHAKTQNLIEFYADLDPNQCSLLIRVNKKTDKIIGRALLWKLDSGSIYLDRIYVADNKDIELFINEAKKVYKAKYAYDSGGRDKIKDETITIKNWKERKTMPYLDTFRDGVFTKNNELILFSDTEERDIFLATIKWLWYATFNSTYGYFTKTAYVGKFKELRDGLTEEEIKSKYKWLWDAKYFNAIIGKDKSGKIIWYDGTWKSGTWRNGIWENGTWKDGEWIGGTWKSGTWRNGIWEDGEWHKGNWKSGTWKSGNWENGHWFNGEWHKGTWEFGVWESGIWKNGNWKDGVWRNGTWENGTWKDGIWQRGIWKDGIWENGTWKDGEWIGGTWKNGKWKDGLWRNGAWKSGTWKSGTWKDGWWKDGIWESGTWEDGIWQNGTWQNGIWEAGEWKDGIWENGTWQNGTWQNGTWEFGAWHGGTWADGVWKNGIWEDGEWRGGKGKPANA